MFTTNPWTLYIYLAGPLIAGYYLFAIAKFYGKEIKARINSCSGQSRQRTDQKAAGHHQDEGPDSGLIQGRCEPGSMNQPDLSPDDKNKNVQLEHYDLATRLTEIIQEAQYNPGA